MSKQDTQNDDLTKRAEQIVARATARAAQKAAQLNNRQADQFTEKGKKP